jgi:fibrillarin-like rRNA methylase
MSQHVVVKGKNKWVFGWDQPLMSFFLQVHDEHFDEDENPVVWLGATADTTMYEVEDLVKAASVTGLDISYAQSKLYAEKDNGE